MKKNHIIAIKYLSLLALFISCSESIGDMSKRNSNWAWVKNNSNISGKWTRIGDYNNVPNCQVTLFYHNGNQYSTYNLVNNKQGDTIVYYDYKKNAFPIRYEIYEKGEIVHDSFTKNGSYLEYHQNGKKHIESYIKNNERGFLWKISDDKGILKSIDITDTIKNIKKTSVYFENGNLRNVAFRKNEKLDSVLIEYYKDGGIKLKQDYNEGFRNGFLKSYFPNGKLFHSVEYKNDVVNGSLFQYDREGNLMIKGFKKNNNIKKTHFYESGAIFLTSDVDVSKKSESTTVYTHSQKPYIIYERKNGVIIKNDTLPDIELTQYEKSRIEKSKKYEYQQWL